MKKLLYLAAILLAFSCKENKKEVVVETEITSKEKTPDNPKISSESSIPIYDYSRLEPILNKNNDTIYVVNFWATWCKPCIKELPAFEKLNAEYASKKVKVILVSLDFPDKLENQVIPFIEKQNIKSDVILLDDADSNSWIPKVSAEWSGAIPATIINHNGKQKFYERSFTFEELENEVKSFL